MKIPTVTIQQLLEAGVHLGHKTLRWNPKMKKYIFGKRDSIHIIDLTQTLELTNLALEKVYNTIINNGKILGIDIKKIQEIDGVKLIQGDFLKEDSKKIIKNYFVSKIDLILSDMASNTTGNKSLDSLRTNQLCLNILDFSKEKLSKNGIVVSKFFMGSEIDEIKLKAKKNFKKINFFKPNSSRDESRETYILCSGLST